MAESSSRCRVLVLGGTGFIGRNLLHFLVTNDLVTKIRVADKVHPQMAWLSPRHKGNTKKVDRKCFRDLTAEYFWSDDPSALGNFITGKLEFS